MAYESLNLKTGDVITEDDILHIEDGVNDVVGKGEELRTAISEILSDKGAIVNGSETIDELVRKITMLRNTIIPTYEYGDMINIANRVQSGEIRLVARDSGGVGFKVGLSTTGKINVDWGDGTSNIYSCSGTNFVICNHTYAKGSGQSYDETTTQFEIVITCETDDVKIVNFQSGDYGTASYQSGIIAFTAKDIYFRNLAHMFRNFTQIKYIDIIGGGFGDSNYITSAVYFCGYCSNLLRITGNFNFTIVTSLSYAFTTCKLLNNINGNIDEEWNTINCIDFSFMFQECNSLERVPKLDMSIATVVNSLYYNCYVLKEIPGETIDCSNINNISYLYYGCAFLTKIPKLINTENITNVYSCYYGCSLLKDLNQDILDFRNATNIGYLCYACSSLESIPECRFDSATTAISVFAECNSLIYTPETISFPNVVGTTTSTGLYRLFYNNFNLIVAPKIIADNTVSINELYRGCRSLNKAQNIQFPNVLYADSVFYDCVALKKAPDIIDLPKAISISSFYMNAQSLENGGKYIKLDSMSNSLTDFFSGKTNLITPPTVIYAPKTSSITQMFNGDSSLTNTPVRIYANSATSSYSIFLNCASLVTCKQIITDSEILNFLSECGEDITNSEFTLKIDFENSSNAYSIFSGCISLIEPPEIFELPKAVNIYQAFYNCNSLLTPPQKIVAQLATNASSLFDGCYVLQYCPELYLDSCVNLSYLYRNCLKLTQGLDYNFPRVTNLTACYQGCTSLINNGTITIGTQSCVMNAFLYGCKSLNVVYFPESDGILSIGNANENFLGIASSGNIDKYYGWYDNNCNTNGNTIASDVSATSIANEIKVKNIKGIFTLTNRPNITSIRLKDCSSTMGAFNISKCGLDEDALNQLFIDLPTLDTAKVLTITGNPGAATCDISIVTAKNWSVVR